jgi:putative sterol carrier protein
MSGLADTVARFVQACNENERLRQMNHDWDRLVVLRPDDASEEHLVSYRGGVASVVQEGEPDLVVEGSTKVLEDIFSGAVAPTEPYMNGDLRVFGSQDDMMRLDIITLLIWGE